MAAKNSNQMTRPEDKIYEELVDGVIVDPFPYKIKTAQFYYGGPSGGSSAKYPIWALTTHFIDGVRQRDVYLISVDYFDKYPSGNDTADLFLKYSLRPMLEACTEGDGMTL